MIVARQGRFSIIDTVFSGDSYQPSSVNWDKLKQVSGLRKIKATVTRITTDATQPGKEHVARGYIKFSGDLVGAPILYREIPLPFAFAEKDPDSMSYKLVDVSHKEPPHTVMKRFMVCGNCHSFSDNGRVIGLDFDAAHRDKGGYFITEINDKWYLIPAITCRGIKCRTGKLSECSQNYHQMAVMLPQQ